MFFNFFTKDFGVNAWMKGHKWCAKTRTECGCRLTAHPAFRSGHFGRITRQEVIHRLCRCQPGYGRHHPKGISREEDDVGGMTEDRGIIDAAIERSAIAQSFEKESPVQKETRRENLAQLVTAAHDYQSRETEPTLQGFLDNVSLLTNLDNVKS